MLRKKAIAILGFPETGKTSYLAALYAVAQSSASPPLSFVRLPPDTTYLDSVLAKLQGFSAMDHTPTGAFESLSLEIRLTASGEEIQLLVPDLSGEEFNHQWENRVARPELLKLYSECDGFLLFLHAKVKPAPSILDAIAVGRADLPVDQPDISGDYDPQSAPAVVKVVSILQEAVRRSESSTRKLAVIASAWDLEIRNGVAARTPDEWLEQDSPLLWQYLQANASIIDYKVFGVSAQGCDYKDDLKEIERLGPVERAFVAVDRAKKLDVTLPLRWVIGSE